MEWADAVKGLQRAGIWAGKSTEVVAARGACLQDDFDCSREEAIYRLAGDDKERGALFDSDFFDHAGSESLYKTALGRLAKISVGSFDPRKIKTRWPEGDDELVELTFTLGKTVLRYELHHLHGYSFDWCLVAQLNPHLEGRRFVCVRPPDDVDLDGVLILCLTSGEMRILAAALGWQFHADQDAAEVCSRERAQAKEREREDAQHAEAEALSRAADALHERGDLKGALALLDRALALSTRRKREARWWHCRGSWQAETDPVRAIADYTRALALREDADSFVERAGLYEKQGDRQAALADWESAIALDPAGARNSLAVLHLEQGDLAAAEAQIRAALEVNERDGMLHCTLAEILAAAGRLPEGLAALQRGVALDEQWRGFAREGQSVASLRTLPEFERTIG